MRALEDDENLKDVIFFVYEGNLVFLKKKKTDHETVATLRTATLEICQRTNDHP